MQEFDEVEWIMGFINNPGDLTANEINRVKNFVFLWNLYETFACNRSADIPAISLAVDNLLAQGNRFDIEALTDVLNYFKDRYVNIGHLTPRFYHLGFTNPNHSGIVEHVLLGQNNSESDVLKALLYIVYRYRNNLFHGNKQIGTLTTQTENFIAANFVIKIVLEAMRTNNMIA
jgi:hypothetical protein